MSIVSGSGGDCDLVPTYASTRSPRLWPHTVSVAVFMCLLGAFEAFEFAGQSYLARQIGYAEEGVIVCTFRNPPELMVYHLPRGRLALRGLLLLLALSPWVGLM